MKAPAVEARRRSSGLVAEEPGLARSRPARVRPLARRPDGGRGTSAPDGRRTEVVPRKHSPFVLMMDGGLIVFLWRYHQMSLTRQYEALPAERAIWLEACRQALVFWNAAAGDSRISEPLRKVFRDNANRLEDAAGRV